MQGLHHSTCNSEEGKTNGKKDGDIGMAGRKALKTKNKNRNRMLLVTLINMPLEEIQNNQQAKKKKQQTR